MGGIPTIKNGWFTIAIPTLVYICYFPLAVGVMSLSVNISGISFYLTMISPLFKNRTLRGAEEKESEMLRHTKMLLLGGSGEN